MSDFDLVEWLRSVGPETWVDHVAMAKAAADEIERLRIQLDAAVRELGEQGRELGKAEADRDRLRAALLDILQTGRREDITAPTLLGLVIRIARQALGEIDE